jgi:hypothetical protein
MMILGDETTAHILYIYLVEGNDNFHAELKDNETQTITLLFDNIHPDNLLTTVRRLASQWFPQNH